MTTTTNYKLAEESARAELAEFGKLDPGSLEHEIALARWILQQAINDQNFGLSTSLISALGRIVKEFNVQQSRSNKALHRDVIRRLFVELCNLFAAEFQDVDDFEHRIDRVIAKFDHSLTHATNDRKQLTELIGKQ